MIGIDVSAMCPLDGMNARVSTRSSILRSRHRQDRRTMSEQTPIHIAPSLALAVIAGLCVLTLTLPAHADEWVTRKIRYKVERGDNITEIAEDHGVTRAEIIRWNKRRLDNPDMVRPGDVLVIKKRVRVREEGRTAKGPPKPLATIERPEGAYPININGVEPPAPGFAYPYSYDNLMRGFDAAGCTHQGLDIGGVGEHYGVGQPIYAIVKAEVILIGLPENDPRRFGRPDRRRGYERRGSHKIPRTIEVPGYGIVHPFTLDKGSARTGVFLVTRAIGTDLDNHKVRYLHLAAVHPDLQVGDIVEAGQEVGLMGGTGFNYTPPHLHLDVEDASGVRVNPAKYILSRYQQAQAQVTLLQQGAWQRKGDARLLPRQEGRLRLEDRQALQGPFARHHQVERPREEWQRHSARAEAEDLRLSMSRPQRGGQFRPSGEAARVDGRASGRGRGRQRTDVGDERESREGSATQLGHRARVRDPLRR